MRVLTFNLWHGLTPTSPLAFTALEPRERRRLRHELQVDVLKNTNFDLGFFQEVNPIVRRGPELARATGHSLTFQPDLVGLKLFGVGVPLSLNSGLAIMANPDFELAKREGFSLARTGPNLVQSWGSWQLKEERFALFAQADVPGLGKTLLINTHLHHGLEVTDLFEAAIGEAGTQLTLPSNIVNELRKRLAMGNDRRALEMGRLLKRADVLGADCEAVILCGDLNASPEGQLAQMIRDHGFRDAWAEVNPNQDGFSFDSERNRANHILQADFPLTVIVEDLSFSDKTKEALLRMTRDQESRPRRIDYVWIKSKTAKIKSAELVGLPNQDGLAPSDHFGVVVDLAN